MFQFPSGGHGTAVLIGGIDFPSFIVNAYTHDMYVRVAGIAMSVHDERLVTLTHFLHVVFCQFRQPVIVQPVFRCRTEGDMQDRLVCPPVYRQMVFK